MSSSRTSREESRTAALATLGPFLAAGVLGEAELHFADAVDRSAGGLGGPELLATALALRAVSHGHVRLDLESVADTITIDDRVRAPAASPGGVQEPRAGSEADPIDELLWPEPDQWRAAVQACVIVDHPTASAGADHPIAGSDPQVRNPLVWHDGALYLERYRRFEQRVAKALQARLTAPDPISVLPTAESSPSTAPPASAPLAAVARTPVASQPSLFDEPDETGATAETDETISGGADGTADHQALATSHVLDRYFPAEAASPGQRAAAVAAWRSRFTVIAGGPGTGKTYTLARLLAAMIDNANLNNTRLSIALTAPTGKAAARMTEAVRQAAAPGSALAAEVEPEVLEALRSIEAKTLYKLLGAGHGGFRYDRKNRLRHDVVIVDETSMVSLPDMARLLDALRDEARLVLVGDPDQLESIEAGSVLGDIVAASDANPALRDSVVTLDRVHRFSAESHIAQLADAVRRGDADATVALLADATASELHWVPLPDEPEPDRSGRASGRQSPLDAAPDFGGVLDTVVANGSALLEIAADGADRADRGAEALVRLAQLNVLCATRQGPGSVDDWTRRIEGRLSKLHDDVDLTRRWFPGRPLLVRSNDPVNRLVNGDVGVTLAPTHRASRPVAVFSSPEGPRSVPVARLDSVETLWAMTIHKSQGSEFNHVVVSLPGSRSRMLSRQLLYTAITRARQQLTIVASEAAIRRAVERSVARASGLNTALAN